MAKSLTQDEFIARAKSVHGDKYDYSHTIYVNMKQKIVIVCPKHGLFQQLPQPHLRGQGCPECGREKQRETIFEKYGVDNPMKSKEIYEKARQTCVNRYGASWAMSNKSVQSKVRETNLSKYGVERPIQNEDVKQKMTDTVKNRYGVENVSQSDVVKQRMKQTCNTRYGTDYYLASKDARKKICDTNMERYGGPAPLSSCEIRKKVADTCFEKYGVSHVSQADVVLQKILKSKFENGTFGKSNAEDVLYTLLCEKFGSEDVERQYSSKVYPFACDFYVKSRDLYIELNAYWTHGKHWFLENLNEDLKTEEIWAQRGSKHYLNALNVWKQTDVKKRNTALQNQLNYIVFWDTDLLDVRLWFSLNCPDGKDYVKSYSWLPDRVLSCNNMPILTDKSTVSNIIKYYQFDVFYKRELALWSENPFYHGVYLQAWLYMNRLKYLDKSPLMLSDGEILRGFTISGILRGYTVFDTHLMDTVVKKYDIHSIYDPCAGWGERMLYSFSHDVEYHGVDVNSALEKGYRQMMDEFSMRKQFVQFYNSATCKIDFESDAVITCPPYGNIERYSENGAENLSETEFLKWWAKVVQNSKNAHIKYFCFQINQKWKDKMTTVVLSNGFVLVDEIRGKSKSCHFTRRNGKNTKREFESMMILQNIDY